eukprot:CAMPEP_0184512334 /NCGR_PEP_ID=MMETSP0198_2-20121128/2822_1 /TAXON_ID=1112570 /ORGANISM="Thraustochytrium sp., Strain LLF1b" /LENGTH=97 /DNA_ID=CAMNT_0026902345 /DNA_START=198 /DNA_END=491 /DNA_ORIENTATION=-
MKLPVRFARVKRVVNLDIGARSVLDLPQIFSPAANDRANQVFVDSNVLCLNVGVVKCSSGAASQRFQLALFQRCSVSGVKKNRPDLVLGLFDLGFAV